MIVPSLRTCLAELPTREATAEVGQLLRWRHVCAEHRHSYGNIGHSRPWSVFPPLQHFLQGENSATPANGRHLVRRIFRHCSVVLTENTLSSFSCIMRKLDAKVTELLRSVASIPTPGGHSLHSVKNRGKVMLTIQIKTSSIFSLFSCGQSTRLTRLPPIFNGNEHH